MRSWYSSPADECGRKSTLERRPVGTRSLSPLRPAYPPLAEGGDKAVGRTPHRPAQQGSLAAWAYLSAAWASTLSPQSFVGWVPLA
jgi:hypothetical protein